jgi:hypothetical protein
MERFSRAGFHYEISTSSFHPSGSKPLGVVFILVGWFEARCEGRILPTGLIGDSGDSIGRTWLHREGES